MSYMKSRFPDTETNQEKEPEPDSSVINSISKMNNDVNHLQENKSSNIFHDLVNKKAEFQKQFKGSGIRGGGPADLREAFDGLNTDATKVNMNENVDLTDGSTFEVEYPIAPPTMQGEIKGFSGKIAQILGEQQRDNKASTMNSISNIKGGSKKSYKKKSKSKSKTKIKSKTKSKKKYKSKSKSKTKKKQKQKTTKSINIHHKKTNKKCKMIMKIKKRSLNTNASKKVKKYRKKK